MPFNRQAPAAPVGIRHCAPPVGSRRIARQMRIPILLGLVVASIFSSACSNSSPNAPASLTSSNAPPSGDARPGLGTKFGETRDSKVRSTNFVRATPDRPLTLATVQYNDAEGARAMGWHGWQRGPVALSDLTEAGFKDAGGKFLPLDSRRGFFSGNKYG